MKQTLLFLIIVFVTFSVNSQSVQPLDYGTFLPINEPIVVLGVIGNEDDDEMTTDFHIENVSDEPIEFRVRRFPIDMVQGSTNKFCWGGLCYSLEDEFSVFTYTMNPGEVINSSAPENQFKGYYYHNGNAGCSIIDYSFIAIDNPDLTTNIRVAYGADSECEAVTSVSELNLGAQLGSAAPNPASRTTMISFDFGRRPSNGVIAINDMMGKKVKEVSVEDRFGVIMLNVDDLPEGIYLYTLSDSNQILATRKLVVSK